MEEASWREGDGHVRQQTKSSEMVLIHLRKIISSLEEGNTMVVSKNRCSFP